jgi:hypothetical protein
LKLKRLFLVSALLGGALLALSLLMIRNPLNLFMDKSDSFSFQAFESIETGTPISAAIEVLGGPVRVEALGADYWRCPECSAYCFACNPPDWLIGYKEAWIYTGPDGLIREKFINTEP